MEHTLKKPSDPSPSKKVPTPKTHAQSSKKSASFPYTALWMVTGLFVLVVGGVSWFFYGVHEKTQAQVTALTENQAQLVVKARQVAETLEAQRSAVVALQTLLKSTDREWLLEDCAHLLRRAQDALSFSKDVSGAIQLLSTAQSRLSLSNDPDLKPLKQAISSALGALRALSESDVHWVMGKLGVLDQQVTHLPLRIMASGPESVKEVKKVITPEAASKQTNETDGTTWWRTTTTQWKAGFQKSLDEIGQLVVLRRHLKPIEPLLSSHELGYLKQNIQWQLQQASWAVMVQNQAVFRRSLKKINGWVTQYFDTTQPPVQAFQETLDALLKVSISPELPSLTPLLNGLNELRAQQSRVTSQEGANHP